MKRVLLAGMCLLIIPAQLQAQSMDHAMMPGMKMPMAAPKATRAKPASKDVARKRSARKAEAAKVIGAPAAKEAGPATDPHAGHDMSGMPDGPTGSGPAADPPQATLCRAWPCQRTRQGSVKAPT